MLVVLADRHSCVHSVLPEWSSAQPSPPSLGWLSCIGRKGIMVKVLSNNLKLLATGEGNSVPSSIY